MNEELINYMNLNTSDEMVRQVAYFIWGSAIATTRAFKSVEIKIDPKTRRIFISVTLYWWANFKKAEVLRRYWLAKAERRCQRHVPEGWRILLYYKKGGNDGAGDR